MRTLVTTAVLCLAAVAAAAPLGDFVVYKAEGGPCSGLCQPGANITGDLERAALLDETTEQDRRRARPSGSGRVHRWRST